VALSKNDAQNKAAPSVGKWKKIERAVDRFLEDAVREGTSQFLSIAGLEQQAHVTITDRDIQQIIDIYSAEDKKWRVTRGSDGDGQYIAFS
jgi:hypothetical protein